MALNPNVLRLAQVRDDALSDGNHTPLQAQRLRVVLEMRLWLSDAENAGEHWSRRGGNDLRHLHAEQLGLDAHDMGPRPEALPYNEAT